MAIQRMLRTHVDPAKMWAAQRGTWLHEQVGNALAGEDGWITEEIDPDGCTFRGSLFGVDLSCKIDARREDYSAVLDYKFRGDASASFIHPDGVAKEEDAAQLNMARLLMQQSTGLDLSDMQMCVWVDARGWNATYAPPMTEQEIGRVRPGGGTFTVEENFRWIKAAMEAWQNMVPPGGGLNDVSEGELEVVVRTMPKVGLDMFKGKNGRNKCTSYCEVAERCFGLEGGV